MRGSRKKANIRAHERAADYTVQSDGLSNRRSHCARLAHLEVSYASLGSGLLRFDFCLLELLLADGAGLGDRGSAWRAAVRTLRGLLCFLVTLFVALQGIAWRVLERRPNFRCASGRLSVRARCQGPMGAHSFEDVEDVLSAMVKKP